jgi:simple sugar transport system ATP-binding protein
MGSAKDWRGREAVLNYIKKVRAENVSSVLVTHNLYHAHQVCDRFVVMKHGQKVYDVDKADTSIEELTRHVVVT